MGKWKTVVAGIFDIADGSLKLLAVLGLTIAIIAVVGTGSRHADGVDVVAILLAIAVPLAVLGILAVIGGISALTRKNWTLAFIGSIAAFIPFSFLGLVALILVAIARDEFEQSKKIQ